LYRISSEVYVGNKLQIFISSYALDEEAGEFTAQQRPHIYALTHPSPRKRNIFILVLPVPCYLI